MSAQCVPSFVILLPFDCPGDCIPIGGPLFPSAGGSNLVGPDHPFFRDPYGSGGGGGYPGAYPGGGLRGGPRGGLPGSIGKVVQD